jgi:hypothetical protein
MKFVSQGHRIYRELGKPLRINIDMALMDVRHNDIDKMTEVMASLEKILSGRFELVPASSENIAQAIAKAMNNA